MNPIFWLIFGLFSVAVWRIEVAIASNPQQETSVKCEVAKSVTTLRCDYSELPAKLMQKDREHPMLAEWSAFNHVHLEDSRLQKLNLTWPILLPLRHLIYANLYYFS